MKNRFNLLPIETKVNVGVRLLLVSLLLCVGQFAFAALAAFAVPIFGSVSTTLGITPEEQAAQEALLKKLKEQNEGQLTQFKTQFQELATQAKAGMIDKATFDAEFKKLTDKLQAFDAEKFANFQTALDNYKTKLEEHTTAAAAMGAEIKKLKEKGIDTKDVSPLRAKLREIIASEEFKAFVESGGKRKVSFEVKATNITDSYTGTSRVHITTRDSRVVDHPQVVRLNIRDLLTVAPTDLPYLAFLEVYDWVRNASAVSENGALAESSFKVREATSDVKRIGTHLPISKRMLRAPAFIENHIATRLPALVRYFEDFQLLYGDGQGNNLTGIFKVADDFATVINAALAGAAGTIASIESYDGGAKTIINFAANQNINNGDTITIANAQVGPPTYNGAHKAIVIGPRQIMIEVAYTAYATAAWTWTVASRFKNNIAFAQEIDVLKVGKSLVTRQEYSCTGIVMHPDDAVFIETLKGNDEHYLDVERLENGVLTIAGVPVVETTAMPSGKFALGDWSLAASLLEFTSLVLEFAESTQEKLNNTIEAIIQEEVIFPIYNKYMFIVGDFATAKAAILKP